MWFKFIQPISTYSQKGPQSLNGESPLEWRLKRLQGTETCPIATDELFR